MGHLKEMTTGSKCDITVEYAKVPYLREVKNLAAAGVIPGGIYNNMNFVAEFVNYGNLPRTDQLLLCDAQTSGGLLIALPAHQAQLMLDELHSKGLKEAVTIGSFTQKGEGVINVK